MKQKIIHHPLRDIILNCDETKLQTDSDNELLKSYTEIHDLIYALLQLKSKLNYEFSVHEDHIADADKRFNPLAKRITEFFAEAKYLTSSKAAKEAIVEIQQRKAEFQVELNDYHFTIVENQIETEGDAIEKDYELFAIEEKTLIDKFNAFRKFVSNDLHQQPSLFTIDPKSVEVDMMLLEPNYHLIQEFHGYYDTVVERYNTFLDRVEACYTEWGDSLFLISEYYNEDGMMDNSLSVYYAKNRHLLDEDRPKYFLSPNDKKIEDFRKTMGMLAHSDHNTIVLDISMNDVEAGVAAVAQELVLALQHFPKLMEKYIFSVETDFVDSDGTQVPVDDWKENREVMKWFVTLNSFPVMIFFLNDPETRSFCLFGDLVDKHDKNNSTENGIAFKSKEVNEICQRLFHSCYMFFMFCHKTGFDPSPYIEALMAEYDLPFTFAMVKEKYLEDVNKGIHFRAFSGRTDFPNKEQ